MIPPPRTGCCRALPGQTAPGPWTRSRARISLLALGLCLAAPGCGLLYDHSYTGETFTLYSDRSDVFVRAAGRQTRAAFEAFGALFSLDPERLGRTTVVLDGAESDVVDHAYSPSVLGYYIPFFNFIHVDTSPEWLRDGPGFKQVLHHEVAHHFIVTRWPRASGECWFNEGLAGALEMAQISGGKAEYPLLNPALLLAARRVAYNPDDGVQPDLGALLAMSWREFHEAGTRERNYALAWSIIYFLLEEKMDPGEPLAQRLEALYSLERPSIAQLQGEWARFLRGFDLEARLLTLSGDPEGARPLISLWALEELGKLQSVDEEHVLHSLATFLGDPRPEARSRACLAFLERLERSSPDYLLRLPGIEAGIQALRRLLGSAEEPTLARQELARAMGESSRTKPLWMQGLVDLLEADQPDLRATAARALAQLAEKPTIVNPYFWRRAPLEERAREVEEWRRWMALRGRPAPKRL